MKFNKPNYNLISASYNNRYENNDMHEISDSISSIIQENSCSKILEAGAGTCHWLKRLSYLNIDLSGIDLSLEMLRKENSGSINKICGNADEVPIKNSSFNLIFCVNALHHFGRKEKFINTCNKLLIKNGKLAIYCTDPSMSTEDWYVYKYFDGVLNYDLERFPKLGVIAEWMHAAGFKKVETQKVLQISKTRKGEEVLKDPFLLKNASSQLASLSETDYEKGMQKIKKELEKCNKKIEFPVEISFHCVSGIKKES